MRNLKEILIIAFLSAYLFNYSQSGFEIVIDDDVNSYLYKSIVDEDGYTYFVGVKIDSGAKGGIFLKVTPSGDYIRKIYSFGGDTLCSLRDVVTLKEGFMLFGVKGVKISSTKRYKYIWVVKLDGQLNKVFEKTYKVIDEFWDPLYKVTMNNDSTIYVIGSLNYDGSISYPVFFRMKFNTNGDTLLSKYHYFDLYSPNKIIYSIMKKQDNNGVYAIATGFTVPIVSTKDLINIDSNLNYTYHPVVNPDPDMGTVYEPMSAIWYDDSTILLSGNIYNPPEKGTNFDYNLVLIDLECNYIDEAIFGRPDTNDYAAWFKSADFIDKNEIFFTGSFQHVMIQPKNAPVDVYVFDENLNIKGMKRYGGEQNYSVTTVSVTPDGGCVIGGTVYNWQDSASMDTDLWIKKVYAEDILTNAEDTPDPNDRDVLVYPNPFNDKLTIETVRKGLIFSLYTITGEYVTQIKIPDSFRFQFNTDYLEKGVYLYKIKYKNKIIQTGKLIKQIK